MAKTFDNIDNTRNIKETVKKVNAREELENYVESYTKSPTSKKRALIQDVISKTPILTNTEKENFLISLDNIATALENIPKIISSDIETLNQEAQYFALLTQKAGELTKNAFFHLCIRLQYMQETKIFPIGITGGLKEYVTNTLKISRSTTYEYLDIYSLFHMKERSEEEITKILNNKTKLRPYIPLLKAKKVHEKDKLKIANRAISLIDRQTSREAVQDAKQNKIKYDLIKEKDYDDELSEWISIIKKNYSQGQKIKEIEWL